MKPPRRERLVPWILAIAALLVICALASRGADGPREHPVMNRGTGTVEAPDSSPTLHGRRPQDWAAGDAPAQTVDPSEDRSTAATVLVRAAGQPGLAAGVHAFVSTTDEAGGHKSLHRGLADQRASVGIPEEWFSSAEVLRLQVGIAGGGVAKQTRNASITRGATTEVVLTLDAGSSLCGRVVTQDGQPVSDIRVVARRSRSSPGIKSTRKYASDARLYSADPFEEGRADTDADGRFFITGLGDRLYFLTTSDMDWMLLPPAGENAVRAPQHELVLVAVQSYHLNLKLRDADSREPVPHARIRFVIYSREDGNYHSGFVCKDGEARIALTPRGVRMRQEVGFDLPVHIRALGYRTEESTLSYGPGIRHVDSTIYLTPVPMGEVRLRVVDSDGVALMDPLHVQFSDGADSHIVIFERAMPGAEYTCRVPAGDWECTVSPRYATPRKLLHWSGLVRVPAHGSVGALVTMPPYGTLVIDGWETSSFFTWIHVEDHRIGTVIKRSHHLFRMPEGSVSYVAKDDAGGQFDRGVVDITAGETVRVRVNLDPGQARED